MLNTLKKNKKKTKLKRVLRAGIPSLRDLSFFIKTLIVTLVIITLGYFVVLSGTHSTTKAESGISDPQSPRMGSVIDSIWITVGKIADGGMVWNQTCMSEKFSQVGDFIGSISDIGSACSQYVADSSTKPTGFETFKEIDMGSTGIVLNASRYLYENQVAHPAMTVQYYAHKAQGKVYAASPTSGREVLGPMFIFSTVTRNIAYAIIVVILVVSGLGTLLSYLGKEDQKVTLVQLMINTGITLFFITFFYEFAAIVYDLTVNYGNSIVASALAPFINAQVILDRLGPGGDLNITALVNVFEMSGVSKGVTTVVNNVFIGLGPALSQSAVSFGSDLLRNAPGYVSGPASVAFGTFGGLISGGINLVATGILGSQAFFNAVIAWAVLYLNLKIFVNLLVSFITFNIYVGFGPLMMLQAVGGGAGKIKETFKALLAYGLVFPLTFLCILIGAAMMNFFIPKGKYETDNIGKKDTHVANNEIVETPLCVYVGTDREKFPDLAALQLIQLNGKDPRAFRTEHTEFQDIYDTTPQYIESTTGKRSCLSSLFPRKWTFFPAPMGNYGNRLLQIQTTDTIMRTIMAIAFLILASRAPKILNETLEIKEMSAFRNFAGALKSGFKPAFSVGLGAFGASLPLVGKAAGFMINKPLPKWLSTSISNSRMYKAWQEMSKSKFANQGDSIAGLMSKAGAGDDAFLQKYESTRQRLRSRMGYVDNPDPSRYTRQQYAQIMSRNADIDRRAEGFASQIVTPKYGELTGFSAGFPKLFAEFSSGLVEATKALKEFIGQMEKFMALSFIDEI